MKNRRMLPGCHPPADAAGDATAEAAGPISDSGSTGSLLEVAAAVFATPEPEPTSRRVTVTAAHANDTAAGESPEPDPSQDNRAGPIELTAPRGVAVITGTSAGASSTAAAGTGATTDPTATTGTGAGDTSRAGTAEPLPTNGPAIATGTPLDSEEMTSEGDSAESEEEVSATTGPSAACTGFLRRGPAESAEPTGFWTRTRGPTTSEDPESPNPEPDPTDPASADPLAPTREPRTGADLPADVDEPAAPDPVEPAEPVVSAKAIGNAATPEPMPNTTARTPTRPTNRA